MTTKYRSHANTLVSTIFAAGLTLSVPAAMAQNSEEVPVLDAFIAQETEAALTDTLMPTERQISGLFGDTTNIIDVPRSVSLLSPEVMEQFDIQDLGDLQKFGAGTQQANYYGVAGTPQIRGTFGGTFFNGMLRAYNRNERPLSFGSLEAMEIVKGPAPANFDPTHVGGFVNLIPKSPYFDRRRGSASITIGSWDQYRMDADVGGPVLLPGDIPGAYRLSTTSQLSEAYYDDVFNDFTSVYAAMKVRPSREVDIFTGVEFFEYRSNENLGWNRNTQNLLNNRRYVIGQGVDITSPEWGGFADRNLTLPLFFGDPSGRNEHVRFGVQDFHALAVPASVVDSAVANGRITAAQRDLMLDLSQAGPDLDAAYGNAEAERYKITQDAYRYTREYLDAGGIVFTEKIDGDNTLSDRRDFADSTNFFWFGDLTYSPSSSRDIIWKNMFEHLETKKNSSHGYGFASEQLVLDTKAIIRERDLVPLSTFSYGAGLRYHDAKQLQDFTSQPYGRRDLIAGATGNDFVFAGDLRDPDGNRLWAPGASSESETIYTSIFGSVETRWTDRLSTIVSGRAEYVDFTVGMPSEVDLASQAQIQGRRNSSGNTSYVNYSVNPNFKIIEGVHAYGAYQQGTSISPTQAGVITGEPNFNDSELIEGGLKFSLIEGRLYSGIAYYQWEQSSFDERAAASQELLGEGIEVEFAFQATENLTLIGAYGWQEVKVPAGPGYRLAAMTEEDWAIAGGVQNVTTNSDVVDEANPDRIRPGYPQHTAKLFAVYRWNNFGLSGGARWQDSFHMNYERTLKAPGALIWDASVFYGTDTWRLRLSGENLFSERYYSAGDPEFAANHLVTQAEPASFTAKFTYFW